MIIGIGQDMCDIRRIEKSLNGFTLGTPEDLEAFAKAIKEG